MGSAVGILVALFLILGIYSLFFGRRVFSADDRDPTRFGTKFTRRGDLWRGAVEGLLLVFAVAAIAGRGFDLLSAVFLGLVIAVLAAVAGLVSGAGRFFIQTAYSVVGLIASGIVLGGLFQEDGLCSSVDPALRTGVVVALVVVWALGLVLGILSLRLVSVALSRVFSRWHAASGLALFGALDVIVIAAGPVGLGVGDTGVAIIFWGVAGIGLLTGVMPELVMLTCALALALLTVVSTYTPLPLDCNGPGSSVPVAMVLGYFVTAAMVSRLTLARLRRGS